MKDTGQLIKNGATQKYEISDESRTLLKDVLAHEYEIYKFVTQRFYSVLQKLNDKHKLNADIKSKVTKESLVLQREELLRSLNVECCS